MDQSVRPQFSTYADLRAIETKGAELVPVKTTYDLLWQAAQTYAERPAISLLETGSAEDEPCILTYAAFLSRVNQCANAFRALGIGREDVIAFLLPTLPDAFVTIFAAQAAGIVCPINHMLSPSHIAGLLRTVNAKLLVSFGPDTDFEIAQKVETIRSALPDLTIVQIGGATGSGILDFDELIASQPDELAFDPELTGESIAALFHTGGTTGTPKLVRHTHANEVYASWLMGLAYDFTHRDVVLNGFPLFHVAGVFCHGLAEISAGAQILIPSKLGMRNKRFVADHWKIVERHRVSILTGGPTFMTTLLNGHLAGEDISSARVLITGGSPLPPELATTFEQRFGVPVRAMFGMTEACGVVSVEPLGAPRVPHSCGFPLPCSEVRVIALKDEKPDPDQPLGINQTGQLIARGKQISPGYTDAARNLDAFLPDGWLKTGDVGHIDEEGRVFITGRAKDVIIRSGHNIDPAIIEEALLSHPAVELCAAVGQPDPYAGELPVAFVQLRPGMSCSVDELMQIAVTHIPERPAYPKRIWTVERFATTATGKILKPELRCIAAEHVVKEALVAIAPDANLELRATAGDTAIKLHVTVSGASEDTIAEVRNHLASFRLPFDLVTM
jgi:fatty-acyl-CoA synthase